MTAEFSALFIVFEKNKYRHDYCRSQLFPKTINIDIYYVLLNGIYSEVV